MKIFCLLSIFLPLVTLSQNSISGKVFSEKDEPLQGASVFIPNSTIGVSTDSDGVFVLRNVPDGNFNIAVSFIGYKVVIVLISNAERSKSFIIKLQPKDNELQAVIVSHYDKEGWKKWGDVFTTAFIGSSVYAGKCSIINKDILHFTYNEESKLLYGYADEPLIIENKSLGYRIYVSLSDFNYNLSTRDVDYAVYSFFTEMKGTDEEEREWNQNREKVYAFSLMHFMRALYANNLKNEGYEVRLLERKQNTEKQRIQDIYRRRFATIRDSLSGRQLRDNDINKLLDKTLSRDSVKYYRKILAQDDRTDKLHPEPLKFKDIVHTTDSNTAIVHFSDWLQVTYKKAKEPEEYYAYRNELNSMSNNTLADVVNNGNISRDYPVTEFTSTLR